MREAARSSALNFLFPPISIGVPKSASAFMKTTSEPAAIVGSSSGIMIVYTLRTVLHYAISRILIDYLIHMEEGEGQSD